jgi:fructose-bisphosphate aldolase, class I
VLSTWAGQEANRARAVEVAGALARANSQAQMGEYQGPHPSLLGAKSLHETHRGWSGAGVANGSA